MTSVGVVGTCVLESSCKQHPVGVESGACCLLSEEHRRHKLVLQYGYCRSSGLGLTFEGFEVGR